MYVPKSFVAETLIVKKSRFIAWAERVDNRAEFKSLLVRAQSEYPDAGHHCWAYSCFGGRDEGCNDDGEPKGTAGRPMLNVLQHHELTNVAVVVSRYFGGVKLGTGGLSRAYSEATKLALSHVEGEPFTQYSTLTMTLDFSGEQLLRHLVSRYNASVNISYEPDGLLAIVQVDDKLRDTLADALLSAFGTESISDS